MLQTINRTHVTLCQPTFFAFRLSYCPKKELHQRRERGVKRGQCAVQRRSVHERRARAEPPRKRARVEVGREPHVLHVLVEMRASGLRVPRAEEQRVKLQGLRFVLQDGVEERGVGVRARRLLRARVVWRVACSVQTSTLR